jgi:OFA family oxalate/formate antiporter-like MFS transporter
MKASSGNLFYGWVIVAAFFAISTIMFGELTSFGVFFKSIEDEFGLNRTATSTIFSVQNLFGAVMSFAGGWAVDKYGPGLTALFVGILTGLSLLLTSQANAYWQLFITYSLLFSVIGVVYTMITSTVSRWFDKNRGIALGIAGSGIGLGAVVIAPLAAYFISSFGWRMAYIIMGAMAWLIIVPLSRLLRRNPSDTGVKPYAAQLGPGATEMEHQGNKACPQLNQFSLREATGTRSFWLILFIWLLNAFCYFIVIIHIVPYATDTGISNMEAAAVLSLIGASLIIGRIVMGRISDSIGRKEAAITCALVAALAMIWLVWSHDLLMLYIFGVVFGFANGGLDTSTAALVGDIFGIRKIGIIMGTLQASWGIGVLAGPAVGGLVFDATNSYFIAFIAGALAMFVIALFVSLIRRETS